MTEMIPDINSIPEITLMSPYDIQGPRNLLFVKGNPKIIWNYNHTHKITHDGKENLEIIVYPHESIKESIYESGLLKYLELNDLDEEYGIDLDIIIKHNNLVITSDNHCYQQLTYILESKENLYESYLSSNLEFSYFDIQNFQFPSHEEIADIVIKNKLVKNDFNKEWFCHNDKINVS